MCKHCGASKEWKHNVFFVRQSGASPVDPFNRLPKWMKEANNRDEVLRVVAKLRQSV